MYALQDGPAGLFANRLLWVGEPDRPVNMRIKDRHMKAAMLGLQGK